VKARTFAAESAKAERQKFEDLFEFQCRQYRLPPSIRSFPMPQSAHPHNARRQWYFDRAFPRQRLLVEIDGGIWRKGGGAHSHPLDIERNMRKQNDATLAGWRILRFTPAEITGGDAIAFTQRVLHRIAAGALPAPHLAPQSQPGIGLPAAPFPEADL